MGLERTTRGAKMTVALYSGYREWKRWSSDPFGACDVASEVYFAAELRASGLTDLRGLSVLEIGFGNGAFAGWASRAGAKYFGTEIIPELVAKGRNAGFTVYDASHSMDPSIPEASIDVVVALDVFEHLDRHELAEMLRSLRGWLRPGGMVIARVPSGDSPFSGAIQHGDLTHRTVLGSSAVRQLAGETGFNVVGIRQPVFPLRGLGPRVFLRRLLVVAARRVAYPIVTHALMGGGQPVLTPNLVFVLTRT